MYTTAMPRTASVAERGISDLEGAKSRNLRVLIAEDHHLVRAGLSVLVRSAPHLQVVGEASNGSEAVEAYRRYLPDVALMDLRMPVMNGIEATEAICKDFPKARILLLTSFEAEEDIYQAIRAGVRGYLLKDMSYAELLDAIDAVARGQKVIPSRISAKLVERMGTTELTLREHEVLQLIATGKTNSEIGRALFISEGTVKTHVNNILTKMGATDRTHAVISGLRRGIIALD